MSVVNQKEYLKKYLGIGKAPGEKRKKKKPKGLSKGLKIVDDNDLPSIEDEIKQDLANNDEDTPQIVAVIDERPPSLRIDDERQKLWKPIGEPENDSTTDISQSLKLSGGFKFNKPPVKDKLLKYDRGPASSKSFLLKKTTSEKSSFKKPSSPLKKNRDNNKNNSPPKIKVEPRSPRSEDNSPSRRRNDNTPPRKIKSEPVSPDSTPPRRRRDSDSSPPNKRSDDDFSPPRRKKRDSDNSPPRRIDEDSSPPRKKRRDSDSSPPRRTNEDSFQRRKRRDSDSSPQRKRRDSDGSPPRKRDDSSPPRTGSPSKKRGGDSSPPRRKHGDSSPSTKRGDGSPKKPYEDSSPPRRKRRDNVNSPPRKRGDSSIQRKTSSPSRKRDGNCSPPRKHGDRSPHRRKMEFEDTTPPRRKNKDLSPPLSPPRKSVKEHEDRRHEKGDRRTRQTEDNPPPQRKHDRKSRWGSEEKEDKMEKTLDGKKAGLQKAAELVKEIEKIKTQEEEMFKNISSEISGQNATTIVRGKKRDIEEEMRQQQKEKEMKEKYDRWGKGLKQVEDTSDKIANDLHEMNKPLARYADDEDLERYLKAQEREGDPMLAYIRKKKRKKAVEQGIPEKPMYQGEFMPNRFGIAPGHRWDGVDRSNGYEKKWFEIQNKKKANVEESYKWSTEDM